MQFDPPPCLAIPAKYSHNRCNLFSESWECQLLAIKVNYKHLCQLVCVYVQPWRGAHGSVWPC